MKQVAVISGKGGTGKTSIAASLANLAAGRAVIADCDVDAPDLHILLRPEVRETRDFMGMKVAVVDRELCTGCNLCGEHCRFGAIIEGQVEPGLCEGCGVCALVCPSGAVRMEERLSGYAYISDTRFGPMVHACLLPGEEASGKLVTMVREMARDLAASRGLDLILIDGSPGIGCPVIASLTGVDIALIVTEPTISGVHDLERVMGVAEHFGAEPLVCINKCDLNIEVAHEIEDLCRARGVQVAGMLPFDTDVVKALVSGRTMVEAGGRASEALRSVWESVQRRL